MLDKKIKLSSQDKEQIKDALIASASINTSLNPSDLALEMCKSFRLVNSYNDENKDSVRTDGRYGSGAVTYNDSGDSGP